MKKVAIIGGGITGLVAAFRIQKSGSEVALLEASGRVGGVIRSVKQDGFLAECGPNTLMDTAPEIAQLIGDLDLESRAMASDPRAEAKYIIRGGEPIALPSSPPGFFTSRLFSWRAKLNLVREPMISPAPAEAEESLAEFVKRRLGQEFLDYAINPFVAGVYAGDPASLSVKHAFPKLYELEQKFGSLIKGQVLGARERKRRGTVSKQNAKKLSFDRGLQVLTDTLGEQLGDAVRLNSPAIQMRRENGSWDLSGEKFDGVLLAAPAFRLAELEIDGAKSLAELNEIRYPPVASVALGFRRENVAHSLEGFGALNPEVENLKTLGAIFSSSLFPNRTPDGHVLFSCYLGGTRAPELTALPGERLIEVTRSDLEKLYGAKGEPVFQHCFVHKRAIPQYEVGFGRFKRIMDNFEKEKPGLFIAGHCRDGIALSDSIVSGWRAAERMTSG